MYGLISMQLLVAESLVLGDSYLITSPHKGTERLYKEREVVNMHIDKPNSEWDNVR